VLRAFKTAPMHTSVRPTGVRTPATPPPHQSPEGGCRVLARAHLYGGARYIVVRGLGLEC
jgi:hypothetical protein